MLNILHKHSDPAAIMAPQMCHARVLVIALGVPRRSVWLGNTEKILRSEIVKVAQDSLCSMPMYSNKMWDHFLLTPDSQHILPSLFANLENILPDHTEL